MPTDFSTKSAIASTSSTLTIAQRSQQIVAIHTHLTQAILSSSTNTEEQSGTGSELRRSRLSWRGLKLGQKKLYLGPCITGLATSDLLVVTAVDDDGAFLMTANGIVVRTEDPNWGQFLETVRKGKKKSA